MFHLLFLSGNPSLLCRGPRGTHCLPQLEPDTIGALPALPCHRARPPGRGQHRPRSLTLGHPPGVRGRREGAGEQLRRPGPRCSRCSEAGNASAQVTPGAAELSLSPGQQPSVGALSGAGFSSGPGQLGMLGAGAAPAAPTPPGALQEPVLRLWGTGPSPFRLLQ